MGFLHEITRKHNPCPLRRMSPRLRRLHSFRPLARLASPLFLLRELSLAFPSLTLFSFSQFPRPLSARFRLSDRSQNLPAVLLRNLICMCRSHARVSDDRARRDSPKAHIFAN